MRGANIMKTVKFTLLSFLLMFLSGCLTFDFWEVRIVFNEGSDQKGKIFITYSGLASDSDSLDKQENDFNEVIESYIEDDFLMDQVREGIYVKKRELFEKDGKLIFNYSGIFNGFDPGPEIQIINDEYVSEFTDKNINKN